MIDSLISEKTDCLYGKLLDGTPGEKLEVIKELYAPARECRKRTDAFLNSSLENTVVAESDKPWREFRNIVGEPLFELVMGIVQNDPPSEVRDQAGDIMAHLWHPCAVGRLLEAYERHRPVLEHSPPLAIYKNLGGIGTEAAARALMWLWGSRWDADIAGALGMCASDAAQSFLVRQAREHSNVHVRAMCMANLKLPVTKEKADLYIDRLQSVNGNECFVSLCMIDALKVACAAAALADLRAKTQNAMYVNFINKILPALKEGTE